MSTRKCLICGGKSITIEDYTPLCRKCLAKEGKGVKPGVKVVCGIDPSCGGTVKRIVDRSLAEIDCDDGGFATVPICELVAC